VDTSGEDTKSGVSPEEAPALAQHIAADCPALRLAGVMTIGAPGDMTCFDKLVDTRVAVARCGRAGFLAVPVDRVPDGAGTTPKILYVSLSGLTSTVCGA
jgi:hypothetical protein